MPPKTKLHGNKGKKKTFTKQPTPDVNGQDVLPVHSINTEEEQFEIELYWCIQQLQAGLSSNKLSSKQAQEYVKALHILTSKTAPLIKKRQVMRLSFGDYRQKIAAEEKKLRKAHEKITLKTVVPSDKSVFVKKSAFLRSDKKFNFNFVQLEEDSATLETNIGNLNLKEVNHFQFLASDNSFRFDFSTDSK